MTGIYNPSYSAGRGNRIRVSRPNQAKLRRRHLKNKTQTKGPAQMVASLREKGGGKERGTSQNPKLRDIPPYPFPLLQRYPGHERLKD
jgi:hypothetical protein